MGRGVAEVEGAAVLRAGGALAALITSAGACLRMNAGVVKTGRLLAVWPPRMRRVVGEGGTIWRGLDADWSSVLVALCSCVRLRARSSASALMLSLRLSLSSSCSSASFGACKHCCSS